MNRWSDVVAKAGVTRPWRRFASTLLIYFVCLMATGLVAYVVLATLLCHFTASNRCFSVSRDIVPVLRLWSVPFFLLASLMALIAYVRRRLIWWHAPVAIALAIIVICALEVVSGFDYFGQHWGEVAIVLGVAFIVWIVLAIGALAAWAAVKPLYTVDQRSAA